MTRPRKQTVDYFPHQCKHGKTIFILEQRYGINGYAFWFKLLELLGSSDGHYVDCNDPGTWEFLQSITRIEADICDEILNLLAKLQAIDPELWEKRIIWSDNFIKGIADAYRNRRVASPNKPCFNTEEPAKERITTPVERISTCSYPQTKLDETKEKDIVGKAAHASLSSVALAEVWNQHAPTCLPRVRFPISEKRQKKFRSALNGQGENYWVHLFQDIDLSDFYTGRDGKWTGMDFDWAVLNHEKLRQKLDRPASRAADHPRATCLPEDPPGILTFDPNCPVCQGDPFKTMGKCKCATPTPNQDQRETEYGTTSQAAAST